MSLNEANRIDSVVVVVGTLAIGSAGALGVGTVSMNGGELLATAKETLSDGLTLSGTSTIAATHGTTLNETPTGYSIGANTILNIGSAGEDETILWQPMAAVALGSLPAAFMSKPARSRPRTEPFRSVWSNAVPTTVDAGASINVAGSNSNSPIWRVPALSSIAAPRPGRVGFSGTISGPLSLVFNGDASLSGLEDYTGGAKFNGSVTVANTGRLRYGRQQEHRQHAREQDRPEPA